MNLPNCESKEELALRDIDLDLLRTYEKKNLATKIVQGWYDGKYQDETIVVEALKEIIISMN